MKLPPLFPNLKAKKLRAQRDAAKAAYLAAKDRGDTRAINATWAPYERAQRACLEAGA